jgi:tetrahydromethanopterin S-methyltransferase subunit G
MGAGIMHEFTVFDLAGVVVIGLVLMKVFGPIAKAIARRIEGRAPSIIDDPAVDQLRGELDELHERVDFLERAITTRQPPTELPKERTPV